MEQQRNILLIALAFTCVLLWSAWQKDHPTTAPISNSTSQQVSTSNTLPQTTIPTQNNTSGLPNATSLKNAAPSENLISINTDVLSMKIDPVGGNIVYSAFPKYSQDLNNPQPFVLLNQTPDNFYLAESALVGKNGPDSSSERAHYETANTQYELQPDNNALNVTLVWRGENGITINKIFTFTRGSYLVQVSYQIINNSKSPWSGNLYTQLSRNEPTNSGNGLFQVHPYMGAAVSSPSERYQEISFKKMQEAGFNQAITGGWAAMVQHYFLSAWIPDATLPYQYYTNVANNQIYTVGMMGPEITVAPNQQATVSSKLYTGPEITGVLKQIAPGLNLTVSYGWLWPISVLLFWLMKKIYDFIGNWGWAIIGVTVLIKLAFYHLSSKSYESMANMRKMTPKIQAIRERYADDKQKQSQEMMDLYRKEKVNPLGGCLPILVQIPVFFALYMVLIESVELRQAPWIGWIHDLSIPDPLYILPILMGLTMLIQQKLNPPPPDPTQAKVMMFLPVVFTFLFIHFPAGLVLYWTVNNGLSVLQQWYVMRRVEKAPVKIVKNRKKAKK